MPVVSPRWVTPEAYHEVAFNPPNLETATRIRSTSQTPCSRALPPPPPPPIHVDLAQYATVEETIKGLLNTLRCLRVRDYMPPEPYLDGYNDLLLGLVILEIQNLFMEKETH
ncbi:hypothetical protein AMTR_s00141p00096940 [Amborella trichopoda]|uniref:Uncharacterized protein n=1 Tax=Amborella trichopoda TaxID=13333 RepID=W1PHB0_AMBTC|nr:hypothetical protein AMTR_s00141p00096940 [Amborella trichopoda]